MREKWENYAWRQLEDVLYLWIAMPFMLLCLIVILMGVAALVWLDYGSVPFVIFAMIVAGLTYKKQR